MLEEMSKTTSLLAQENPNKREYEGKMKREK